MEKDIEKITAVLGPTNTGKTHLAVETMLEYESGIIWNDPEINIQWPVETPVLSEKDLQLPSLTNSHNNFSFESIQQ